MKIKSFRWALVLGLSGLVFGPVFVGGCAHGTSMQRTAAASDLTVDQAEHIVDQFANRHTMPANTSPLNDPKSLADVLEVLRLDQIDLFAHSTKFAAAEGSVRGKALAGQMLISWGQADYLLADLLSRATQDLQDQKNTLEKRRALSKLSDEEAAHAQRVTAALDDIEGVASALRRIASHHVTDGSGYAKAVIAAAPNDYEGYRVAADYYEATENWTSFDTTIAKLEALKPDSTGLIFLKGAAARDRDHDSAAALRYFKESLARDPQFVRAQVAIVVLQPDINGAYSEMNKLAALNPNHQIVKWMGPTLKHTYDQWLEINRRRAQHDLNRALPGANE